jgi:hypothetical protein
MKILLLGASMTNIGIAMAPGTLYRLAPPLIALQFAAFGWRVNREINLATAGGIPIPDALPSSDPSQRDPYVCFKKQEAANREWKQVD